MSALSGCTILLKGSNVPGKVPALSSLELKELAVNTADAILFTKTATNEVASFLNSTQHPLVLDQTIHSVTAQYGNNTASGVFGSVLNGYNNHTTGSGSTTVNGENNSLSADYAFIGSGLNNTIEEVAEYGAILGGTNNSLKHQQSFIIGSGITSHAEQFTYVNNLSAVGAIHGTECNIGTGATTIYVTEGAVGINTETPTAALEVNGDSKFGGTVSIATGIILKSPNGAQWMLTVANDGSLSTTQM